MDLILSKVYICGAIFVVIMLILSFVETIYLKRTKHDDHPSRYVNEVFYEEIMKTDKH